MVPVRRFEDLVVWKEAMRTAVLIYQLFGESRDYGFRDQICRSAVSVASNIAEGYDRDSNKEFIRYLHIAMGSNAELRTQLYLAQRLNKADPSTVADLIKRTKTMSAQLYKLIHTRKNDFK